MKKITLLPIFLLAATLIPTSQGVGVYANQQLMSNPFMTGADYTGWSPISPWRNNGAGDSQVFDFTTTGPTGFFLTNQTTVDIKTTGAHTADPDYNVNTARLTAIDFNGIFLDTPNPGDAGAGLDANFFIEFNITTTTDSYRASSTTVTSPWTQSAGTYLDSNTDYTWQTGGGFSGDPFAGGGLILADISAFDANYFMQVSTNNASGVGTVFTTLDNASIQYSVTVVPEPSTYALVGVGLLAMVMFRRRQHRLS